MFMDDVDYRLNRASQSDSPIRKLSLSVVINDSKYNFRVDTWLELIKQMKVENLCISIDQVRNALYMFPVSLLAFKSLRSVNLQGECVLSDETFTDEISFYSLQQLSLSYVYLVDDDVVGRLARFCQGIEMLVLDACFIDLKVIELGKFPKLKKAVIEHELAHLGCVDIVGTNLECFNFVAHSECRISRDACAGIREFTLVGCRVNQPDLFKDLTATFPLIEQVDVDIFGIDTFKAASTVLRKLKFVSTGSICVEKVHIDCPNLTLLDFKTSGMTDLYVDCPNLRVLHYCGSTVPEQLFFRSIADLQESSCDITINHAYQISWFINLRAFLILIMATTPTNVSLHFTLPMMGFIWFCKETFNPEELKAVQASPQYDVNLTLAFTHGDMQSAAALMDAVLWIIRPTTLTINYTHSYLVKYLCENLLKKHEDKIGGEQFCHPCWLHHIEVESLWEIPDIKPNFVSLAEHFRMGDYGDHQANGNQICFKFHWCCN